MKQFTRVLIANRGEIACRIIRSLRQMKIAAVVVYTAEDRHALFVKQADHAHEIGSYLHYPEIVAVAQKLSCQAIHPGYGFLSERPELARSCAEADLVFIGPSAETIIAMGDKQQAITQARKLGIPCLESFSSQDFSTEELVEEAAKLGYPVLIKAVSGGGGRGQRIVSESQEFTAGFRAAQLEARTLFQDARVLIERFIPRARHIEVQVLVDQKGQVAVLGERECSVQRRHQKLIEETPCHFISEALRRKLYDSARAIAKSCGYLSAGTVEFLITPTGEYYFLEMNTRIQVEHPVTEMVTGLDLIEWQVRIAQGENLPWAQEPVLQGHAIEARICAEDDSFVPQTGRVFFLQWPEGTRVDHGLEVGSLVSSSYDSMLGKIIAHAPTRVQAIEKLVQALQDLTLFGVTLNQKLLLDILESPNFVKGEIWTKWLEDEFLTQRFAQASRSEPTNSAEEVALACVIDFSANVRLTNWPRPFAQPRWYRWQGAQEYQATLYQADNSKYRVAVGQEEFQIHAAKVSTEEWQGTVNGKAKKLRYYRHNTVLYRFENGSVHQLVETTLTTDKKLEKPGSGAVCAPMDGKVIDVFVKVGAAVRNGDKLLVLEAMKMQNQICADLDGTVSEMVIERGEQVRTKQLLVKINP